MDIIDHEAAAPGPIACPSRGTIFKKLVFILGQVRLRHFLGQVLRLLQAMGSSAAASGPSAAARTG